MKVYFYSNQYLDNKDSESILSYLKKAGVEIVTNISSQKGPEKDSLDKVDAFIFQGFKLDTKVSYLIALTLAQNKEVLCLLPKGSKLDASLKDLGSDSKLAKKIHIELYEENELKEKVFSFLREIDNDSVRELFNIKYTLRVSRKINDYLNWKAKEVNVKKADWIRDKIQEFIDNDEKYQEYLKNKYKS